MTTSVLALRDTQSLRLASALALARGEDHIPVVAEDGRFLGIVDHRNLIAADRILSVVHEEASEVDEVPLSAVVSPLAETLEVSTSAEVALQSMLSSGLGVLPVLDVDGGYVGLVTVDSMLALLEERVESSWQTVTEVMTRALTSATEATTAEEAMELMEIAKVRHLPVIGEGKLKTVVSRRDLLAFLRLAGEEDLSSALKTTLEEFVGKEIWTTTKASTIAEVVRTLRDNRFGCLPIVEEGYLLGIVTESDLLKKLLQGSQKPAQIDRTSLSVRSFLSTATPVLSTFDSLKRGLQQLAGSHHSTLLICEGDEAVGALSQGDLLRALDLRGSSDREGDRMQVLAKPIASIMTRGVVSIDASQELGAAARLLIEHKVHSLFAFDGKRLLGTFGPIEIFRAAGFMRVPWILRDVMTNVLFEIDSNETLQSGFHFLASAGVRGLVVRDNEHPVGIFGQEEALVAAKLSPDTPLEEVMSPRILCLPDDTPCYRAAQQAAAFGVHQVVVTSGGNTCGLASASDFVHLLRPTEDEEEECTLDNPILLEEL